MKTILSFALSFVIAIAGAQSIVGTWQQTEKKTCFDAEMKLSETEKELLPKMGDTSETGVASLISFDKKGRGETGIFSQGEKKGEDKTSFNYRINNNELLILDKKSGIATQHFIVDELTESTMKMHDAKKECEIRVFARVK